MKRLMAATAALSLIAGSVLADPPKHDHDSKPPAGGGHGGGATAGGHAPAPGPGPGSGGLHAYVPQGRGDVPHPEGGSAPPPKAAAVHQGRSGFGAPGFTASTGDRPRYDPQHFPAQVRAKQHFGWRGAGAWHDQPGFYYRRWAYGEFLPVGWFAADFWINDYDDYDLPVPPYGYEWVRSGPDALLVDTYTGEVVESVYGVF